MSHLVKLLTIIYIGVPFPEEAPGTVGLPQTPKTLNITMDITHGLLFVGVWITVLFVICYILAVIDANRKKREEEKEKYKSSPLDVFWRNLK